MQKTERTPVVHFSEVPEGKSGLANNSPVAGVYSEGVVYPAKTDTIPGEIQDIEDFGPRHPKAEISRRREIELGMTMQQIKATVRQELFGKVGEPDTHGISDEKVRLLWNDHTTIGKEMLDPDATITQEIKDKLVVKVARKRSDFREARDELVMTHLGIVKALAYKYRGRGKEIEELEEVGYVEIIRSAENYDWQINAFGTYAYVNVRGAIRREFRDGKHIKLPRRINENLQRVHQANDELTGAFGDAPSYAELAAYVNSGITDKKLLLTEADVYVILKDKRIKAPSSLNERIPLSDSDDAPTRMDTITYPEQDVETPVDNRIVVFEAINALPDREKTIIFLYYWGGQSQTQIATEVGLSQMHVSRRLSWAANTLGMHMGISRRERTVPSKDNTDQVSTPPEETVNVPDPKPRRRYNFEVTVRFDPSVIRPADRPVVEEAVPKTEPVSGTPPKVHTPRAKPAIETPQHKPVADRTAEGMQAVVEGKSFVSIGVLLALRPDINRPTMKRWLGSVTHLSGYGNNKKTFLYDEREALALIDSLQQARQAPKTKQTEQRTTPKRNYTMWYGMDPAERVTLIEQRGREMIEAGRRLDSGKFDRVVNRYYPGGMDSLQTVLANNAIIAA